MHTDGVTVFSEWPLQHFFDYIFSSDSIVSNLQYPGECQGELWIIVRGDGLPCGGESWCQMSISFANHGHLARTLSYHWTVNVALCGEKSTSVLSQVWANNLAFLQSALDSGVVPIRGASRRCRIFCGGDSPWLRRLSGITTHWMARSLFSYMMWCKSSATWLQQDVDRTTERDEQLLGLVASAYIWCCPEQVVEGASEAASPYTMCSAPSDFCREAGHCLGTHHCDRADDCGGSRNQASRRQEGPSGPRGRHHPQRSVEPQPTRGGGGGRGRLVGVHAQLPVVLRQKQSV